MITVTSVEIIHEEVDVYDIEVEEDHSFLVAGVVLHNSAICLAYGHKMWTLEGHHPIGHSLPYKHGVPRHPRCRSTEVAVLKSYAEIGGRILSNTNGETLDSLFRQKLRERDWSEERIAKAQIRTQASMDGQISREVTPQEFLMRKGKAFQEEQLGKGKAELFQRGVITDVSQLVDGKGNPLTVNQYRQHLGVTQ